MTTRPGYVWDATASEWVEIGQAAVVAPVAYQASEPSSPATGDIWIDSDDEVPSVDSTLYYRWTKTMSGGETSLSGTDDNSLALKYTPGYESVFINGVLQVRGSDYVATTGTTVTGLTALTASDVVMVESIIAYSVGDTYTQSQISSLLDAKSPVSTTGLVLLNTTTFSAVASASINNCFTSTYANYFVTFQATQNTTTANIGFRYRVGGADNTTSSYYYMVTGLNTAPSADNLNAANQTTGLFTKGFTGLISAANLNFFNPQVASITNVTSSSYGTSSAGQAASYVGAGLFNATTQFDGITFTTSAGTITGTIKVYGYK
jgi:hypothetical protein